MPADPRLPLKIKAMPGGYRIEFADGSPPLLVYGREPAVARAANARTLAEAKALARDVARALTGLWSAPNGPSAG